MVAPNIGGETSVYGRLRRKQPGRRTRRDFWGKGGLQLRERSTPASKQRVSHMLGAMEGVADSRSPRGDIYQAGEERQMVKVGGEKKWLKRSTLEFGIKYGGWQKPEETNGLYIL